MFNGLITTMDKYPVDLKTASGLIDTTRAGAVKEYQKVLSVGPSVRGIEVGDIVYINPKRYEVREHREGTLKDGIITDNPIKGYKFEIVEINDTPCLYIFDNDVKYVAEVEEFEENPAIIMPEAPKIVLD